MAARHGKNAAITFNSVNLGPFCTEGSLNIDIDTADTSTFGTNWKNYLSGQGGGTLEMSGNYDPVAGGPTLTITSRLFSDSTPVVWYPGGNTTGQLSASFNAIVSNYTENAAVGDKVGFSASLTVTGPVTWATV